MIIRNPTNLNQKSLSVTGDYASYSCFRQGMHLCRSHALRGIMVGVVLFAWGCAAVSDSLGPAADNSAPQALTSPAVGVQHRQDQYADSPLAHAQNNAPAAVRPRPTIPRPRDTAVTVVVENPRTEHQKPVRDPLGYGAFAPAEQATSFWEETTLPQASAIMQQLRSVNWRLPTLRQMIAHLLKSESLPPKINALQDLQSQRLKYLHERLRTLMFFDSAADVRRIISRLPQQYRDGPLLDLVVDLHFMDRDLSSLCTLARNTLQNPPSLAAVLHSTHHTLAQIRVLCLALAGNTAQAELESSIVAETFAIPTDNLFQLLLNQALLEESPNPQEPQAQRRVIAGQLPQITLRPLHLLMARVLDVHLPANILRTAAQDSSNFVLLSMIARNEIVDPWARIMAMESLLRHAGDNRLAYASNLAQLYRLVAEKPPTSNSGVPKDLQEDITRQRAARPWNLAQTNQTGIAAELAVNPSHRAMVQLYIHSQHHQRQEIFLDVHAKALNTLQQATTPQAIDNLFPATRALGWLSLAWQKDWEQAQQWLPSAIVPLPEIQRSWKISTQIYRSLIGLPEFASRTGRAWQYSNSVDRLPSPIVPWLIGHSLAEGASLMVPWDQLQRWTWSPEEKDSDPPPYGDYVSSFNLNASLIRMVGGSVSINHTEEQREDTEQANAFSLSLLAPQAKLLPHQDYTYQQRYLWYQLLQFRRQQTRKTESALLAARLLNDYTQPHGLYHARNIAGMDILMETLSPFLSAKQRYQLALELAIIIQP